MNGRAQDLTSTVVREAYAQARGAPEHGSSGIGQGWYCSCHMGGQRWLLAALSSLPSHTALGQPCLCAVGIYVVRCWSLRR